MHFLQGFMVHNSSDFYLQRNPGGEFRRNLARFSKRGCHAAHSNSKRHFDMLAEAPHIPSRELLQDDQYSSCTQAETKRPLSPKHPQNPKLKLGSRLLPALTSNCKPLFLAPYTAYKSKPLNFRSLNHPNNRNLHKTIRP